MRRKLTFQWAASTFFGWGVYGLNLALHSAARGVDATAAGPVLPERLVVDPLRRAALAGFMARSNGLSDQLKDFAGRAVDAHGLVLHALGNDLSFAALGAHDSCLSGRPSVGVVFSEDTGFSDDARRRAAPYPLLVAGSHWNAEMLAAAGFGPCAVVLQGVDTTLFHPAPRAGMLAGRFVVFSGGKLEYRKGQDLVLRAFRLFQARHPEALLITAWHSPWGHRVAGGMAACPGVAPLHAAADGSVDVRRWAADNGLPAHAFVDLGAVPNAQMPPILREADVAVFPSRCEGGTNLVAMEAMACGVPCVLSDNTGHRDLIADGNCLPLRRQGPVPAVAPLRGTEGWGESDPEEIVDALERVHADRQAAAAIGARGAETLARLSWQGQIAALIERLGPFFPG